MATYTNNYALIKPSAGEPASRVPLNTNFDNIDDIMHNNAVAIRNAEAMIAPAFNNATAYAIGDKVTYNHHLYIFKTAHSAGDWNGNEVKKLENSHRSGACNCNCRRAGLTIFIHGGHYYCAEY